MFVVGCKNERVETKRATWFLRDSGLNREAFDAVFGARHSRLFLLVRPLDSDLYPQARPQLLPPSPNNLSRLPACIKTDTQGVEAYGIYKIGEIIGRRHLVGYKVNDHGAGHAHH